SALPDAARPRAEHLQGRRGDRVGPRQQAQEGLALGLDAARVAGLDRHLEGSSELLQLAGIGERRQGGESIAAIELAARLGASRRPVRNHSTKSNARPYLDACSALAEGERSSSSRDAAR